MEILYVLIPVSVVLVLAILGVLGWAVFSGQFEDLEQEGLRILQKDDGKPDQKLETSQE
ncbi:cbb3-type cytochrome oxidase assembly protein CcoS [Aquabacterium sp.]|mgnify:CR=1 FL=1|uniref:cbb3-type cytochrome oxidase assembly protein CcoS n=1 Tax=Aquabacterium sp. TaxID=1872578 RepID=UPI002E376857|nr:cbb3-type cytochrome oxidase assembly protein CcoS [Aquabacterium sp.]HEX5310911.1 cbb3-type cytochrome oxidase assembly protein CcoS [Aquabacterium sp.]